MARSEGGNLLGFPASQLGEDDLFQQAAVVCSRRRLALSFDVLGEENIGQFPERGGPALRRLQCSRIAAVSHRAERLTGKGSGFVGGKCPDPPKRQAPCRCPAAGTGSVLDDVGFRARSLHAQTEAKQAIVPNEAIGPARLEAVHQALGDPTTMHGSSPGFVQGTTEEPPNRNSRQSPEITIIQKCRKSKAFCNCRKTVETSRIPGQ